MLNSSEFRTGAPGEHFSRAHPPVRISLCARISFVTSVRPSTQNGWGTVHPAYCGELFTHHDTSAKSSSPCCMVAVLIISEYICKLFSTVWVCALIPNYSPSRWRIECICMARQNDSDDRSNIADIDHTPHRNRHLTVFHKRLRTSPAIPTSIVRRILVLAWKFCLNT